MTKYTIMKKLKEYQIEIKNEQDFEKWRSTWISDTSIPKEVVIYMKTVVFPKMTLDAIKTINQLNNLRDENKRII